MLWLVVFCSTASAASETMRCVQNQLTALGVKAGVADGYLGPQTQRGYSEFLARDTPDPLPPKLTPSNAVAVCRLLGLQNEETRHYWPSTSGIFDFTKGGLLDDDSFSRVKNAALIAAENISKLYAIDLADKVTLIAGADYAQIRHLVEKRVGFQYSTESFNTHLADTCGHDQIIRGFASPAYMVVCFAYLSEPEKSGANARSYSGNAIARSLNETVTHEYVHAIQYQLAGLSRRDVRRVSQESLGPRWLIEGVAQYVALKVQVDNDKAMQRLAAFLPYIYRHPRGNLPEFERRPASKQDKQQLYELGFVAVTSLVKMTGEKNLFDFYHQLGLGLSPDAAFTAAFGMTIEHFYMRFAES